MMEVFIHVIVWLLELFFSLCLKFKSLLTKLPSYRLKTNDNILLHIPGPFSLPIIGSSWLYSWFGPYSYEKYHESNEDKFRIYGSVVREHVLWNFPLVHLFDAYDIDRVLNSKCMYPYRPANEADVYYRLSRPEYYNNVGIVNLNGKQWDELRCVLTKPLTNRNTPKNYINHMNLITEDFIELLRNSRDSNDYIMDYKDVIYRAGLETVCTVTLEQRMGFLENSVSFDTQTIMNSIQGYQDSSNNAMYGLPWWKYAPKNVSSVFTKLVKYKDHLFTTFGSMVDNTLSSIHEVDDSNQSIIHQLLRSNVDIKDVKASVVDYITAGVDTIGNSVIFALLLLAKYPDKQIKLQTEVDSILRRGDITLENLSELKYLKACIQESFRMYPTASQIARIIQKRTVLKSGIVLPKDTVVLCHHRVASLKDENFTRASEFIPERWIPSEVKDYLGSNFVHNASLVIPFGSGKRICPGKRLAEQEIMIILAKTFQAFYLQLKENNFDVDFRFLLTPSDNIRICATERN